MPLSAYFASQYQRAALAVMKRRILLQQAPARMDKAGWPRSLASPTEYYLDCFRFFHQRAPKELRDHRAYFCAEGRGIGEAAMHVMWLRLFEEFKPSNFLEIGVYRGQKICLAALLGRLNGAPCEVCGISPFSPAGDSVSLYPGDVDYYQDTIRNFAPFSLPHPHLLKAFSTDPAAVALIQSRSWDMIFIDGNHEYEIVRKDWEVCANSVKSGGVIVLDDAGLTTSYQPPRWLAAGGHPGPSRLAGEIDRARFREILQVGHNRAFQKI